MPILVSDAKCQDCSGPVTLFLVPDKIWFGLGLTTEWLCLSCLAHRLNPAITAEALSAEIYRQRRRFKLKRINRYFGLRIARTQVAIAEPGEDMPSALTMKQVMGEDVLADPPLQSSGPTPAQPRSTEVQSARPLVPSTTDRDSIIRVEKSDWGD